MSQRQTSYILMSVFLVCLPALVSAEQVTITGRVLGPDGQRVADCYVLARYNEAPNQRASVEARTDAAGTFSFNADVRGPYRRVTVAAHKPGLVVGWASGEPEEELTVKLSSDGVACMGTVSDPEGNPIHGVRVSISGLERQGENYYYYVRQRLSLGQQHLLTDTSDGQGRFEISDLPRGATVSLKAMAAGWAQVTYCDLPAGKHDIRLILQPDATISGRVTRNGRPVAGVSVTAEGEPTGFGRGRAISGEDGTYTIDALVPGAYYVVVHNPPEGLTARAITGIRLNAGDHFASADLQLVPGGLVTGRVTETQTGRPVAGAYVVGCGPPRPGLQRSRCYVTTDHDGNYTVRLPAGPAIVYYHQRSTDGTSAERPQPRRHWVEVKEGETVTGANFVVHALRLEGRVLGPDGQTAASVSVAAGAVVQHAKRWIDFFFGSTTDQQGQFDVAVSMPRQHQPPFVIVACADNQSLAGIAFVDEPNDPVEIRLGEGAYLLTEVIDTEGQPLANTPVRLCVMYQGLNGRIIPGLRTDAQGRLRIGPLPRGVQLRVMPADETALFALDPAVWDYEGVKLDPGEEYQLPPLQLNLEGRTIRGWAGDQDQRPVPGALIFATDTAHPAWADERGFFELRGVPLRDTVEVTAVHPTKPLFAATELDPDWGFEARFMLQPPGRATGRVCDDQGEPIVGATVRFRTSWDSLIVVNELLRRLGEAGYIWYTVTDQDGRWTVGGLAGGAQYYAVAFLPDAVRTSTRVDFTAQAGETIDLGEMVLKQ